MKSSRSYFLYSFLIFGTLLLMSYIDFRLELIAEQDYRVWKWVTIKQFLYIPVGFVLAFPCLFKGYNKNGSWKIDYKKLLFFGIPALYLTFYLTLYFFTPLNNITLPWFVVSEIELYKLGGIILGYVIASSFYKTEKD
jgi:hypothetical protein